jgi:hypothetical protein
MLEAGRREWERQGARRLIRGGARRYIDLLCTCAGGGCLSESWLEFTAVTFVVAAALQGYT